MDKHRTLENEIQQYQGVVFDLDGTLVDLKVDWVALKQKLAEEMKIQTGEDIEFTPLDQKVNEIKQKFGGELFRLLLGIISEYELQESKYVLNSTLIKIFDRLDEQKMVAIYSMNTYQCVDNFVKKYLKKKPDILVTKDDCIEPKPSGKDLKSILSKWKLTEKDIIYVGNSDKDQISGESVGIKTLIISFA